MTSIKTAFLLIFGLSAALCNVVAEEPLAHSYAANGLTITSDFPGGNISIISVNNKTITFTPDLRGGRDWFYWNFKITSDKDLDVTFIIKSASPFMGMIGMQGPAISTDNDVTWDWLGAESMTILNRAFTYSLKKDTTIHLASTIPYMQKDLDLFLSSIAANPHVKNEVLTKSRKGRPVELLTIGTPGDNRKAVLFTVRHHACETMTSFLMEGFLSEAISDSEEGKKFREKYVLYVVPMVDKDGVQDGDQGKNRRPHDHNRDYNDEPLYPEVKAIKELATTKKIQLSLDWHCPTLSMDIHQAIYFVGPKDRPATNLANVTKLFEAMKEKLPKTGPGMYRVDLKDSVDRGAGINSDFFSLQPGVSMAATLEFPFAPKNRDTRPDSCRASGVALLSAWNATDFTFIEQ